MSPLIRILARDKASAWTTMDFTDIEGVESYIFIPLFGRDHHAGFDCWCRPVLDNDGVISHRQHH